MFGDVYNIIVETGELHWTDWNDYKLNTSALGYIATVISVYIHISYTISILDLQLQFVNVFKIVRCSIGKYKYQLQLQL